MAQFSWHLGGWISKLHLPFVIGVVVLCRTWMVSPRQPQLTWRAKVQHEIRRQIWSIQWPVALVTVMLEAAFMGCPFTIGTNWLRHFQDSGYNYGTLDRTQTAQFYRDHGRLEAALIIFVSLFVVSILADLLWGTIRSIAIRHPNGRRFYRPLTALTLSMVLFWSNSATAMAMDNADKLNNIPYWLF